MRRLRTLSSVGAARGPACAPRRRAKRARSARRARRSGARRPGSRRLVREERALRGRSGRRPSSRCAGRRGAGRGRRRADSRLPAGPASRGDRRGRERLLAEEGGSPRDHVVPAVGQDLGFPLPSRRPPPCPRNRFARRRAACRASTTSRSGDSRRSSASPARSRCRPTACPRRATRWTTWPREGRSRRARTPCLRVELAHHGRVRAAARKAHQAPHVLGREAVRAVQDPRLAVGLRERVDVEHRLPRGAAVR